MCNIDKISEYKTKTGKDNTHYKYCTFCYSWLYVKISPLHFLSMAGKCNTQIHNTSYFPNVNLWKWCKLIQKTSIINPLKLIEAQHGIAPREISNLVIACLLSSRGGVALRKYEPQGEWVNSKSNRVLPQNVALKFFVLGNLLLRKSKIWKW